MTNLYDFLNSSFVSYLSETSTGHVELLEGRASPQAPDDDVRDASLCFTCPGAGHHNAVISGTDTDAVDRVSGVNSGEGSAVVFQVPCLDLAAEASGDYDIRCSVQI